MKPTLYAQLLAFCSLFLVAFHPCYGAPSETITLNPVADSYIDSANQNNNYGGSMNLFAQDLSIQYGSDLVKNAYLMFDLSTLPIEASIQSAILVVHIFWIGSTTNIYTHYCSDVSWNELSITWSNAPTYEQTPVTTVVVAKSGDSPPIDVTLSAQKAWISIKRFTLVITSEKKTGIGDFLQFYSRKSALKPTCPQLAVTYTVPFASSGASMAMIGGLLVLVLIVIGSALTYKRFRRRKDRVSTSAVRIEAPIGPPSLEKPRYCVDCGVELQSLGETGKSFCPKCNKLYEQ